MDGPTDVTGDAHEDGPGAGAGAGGGAGSGPRHPAAPAAPEGRVPIWRVDGEGAAAREQDAVVVEEPLEVRHGKDSLHS